MTGGIPRLRLEMEVIMALLLVDDFPDELYAQLASISLKNGLNVEQETLVLLEQAIRQSLDRELVNRHINEALFDAPEALVSPHLHN